MIWHIAIYTKLFDSKLLIDLQKIKFVLLPNNSEPLRSPYISAPSNALVKNLREFVKNKFADRVTSDNVLAIDLTMDVKSQVILFNCFC